MTLLEGRTGLVFGVANERSIAWHIAKNAIEHGAVCAFSHLPGDKMAARVKKALDGIGADTPWMYPCDASKDEDLDALFSVVKSGFGAIDFVVHSIAYADREYLKFGTFASTPRAVFQQALDISVYTLVAIADRARELMPNGGPILALSFCQENHSGIGIYTYTIRKESVVLLTVQRHESAFSRH